jgi:hypothetical protein
VPVGQLAFAVTWLPGVAALVADPLSSVILSFFFAFFLAALAFLPGFLEESLELRQSA